MTKIARAALLLLLLLLSLSACQRDNLPDPGSDAYRETVTAFHTSLASIQAGSDVGAEDNLLRVTELAPGEPAGWANLGVLALRQNRYEDARDWLQRAQELAPDNSDVEMLLAQMHGNQGNFDQAVTHLRRAVELDPSNLMALYALAQAVERQGGPDADAELQRLLDSMLRVQPDNTVLLLEQIRLAARRNDRAAAGQAMQRLTQQADGWPEEVREQFAELQTAVAGQDLSQAGTRVAFLRNTLLQVPAFRRDLAALQASAGQVGELMTRFVRLPAAQSAMAPPDTQLTIAAEPVEGVEGADWTWAGAMWLDGEQAPTPLLAGPGVQIGNISLPGGSGALLGPSARGIAPLDFNYDYRTDLALAGPGGVQLYRQDSTGTFTSVTAATGLTSSVTGGSYTGAWPSDIDLEGDLDVVLGRAGAAPLVLRNNGDGTFAAIQPFEGITGLQDFAWADLDADGDPDAALLDAAGRLHVRLNERSGQFRDRPLPDAAAQASALTVADIDSDGLMDLLTLGEGGVVRRISAGENGTGWVVEQIVQAPNLSTSGNATPRLFVADLDNNGGLDLVASGSSTSIWLQGPSGTFQPLGAAVDAAVTDMADLTGDGRLDLIGLQDGRPVRLVNQGTADYHWQVIRPRAALASGDQRINSFGIGGEVEVRAGLLFQKQPITAPAVHFGLGEHEQTNVARIIWPNGDVQAEFDLAANEIIPTPQRLKGSCPWLFTFDGEEMVFVTDFLWRSPLGLAINAQETAGTAMTEDRVKIRGGQLSPLDGFYDIRITAELWETHFFDHVSLLVVDHPADTDIFVDERFAFPPPDLGTRVTAPVQPLAGAWNDAGEDVSGMIRERDGRYLDTFGTGQYQGITRDHYVEIEIPADAPAEGLRLIAFGWVRPTDSSINVAISQGSHAQPSGLSLEVPDRRGGWTMVQEGLGFPAGKLKTIVLDLDGVFTPGAPRRLRLHTNLEIYWDHLGWAEAQPQAEVRTQRLMPQTADLRYRGFSQLAAPDRSSPEVPTYDLEGTAPRWRDLVGYHTRFGDVRELLETVDDRYVIMNAGDEMQLLFPAPPPPPDGWQRDFVLIGDGWEKDGDYNTLFSKTVLPLPSHDDPAYATPPGALEDDPVYQRYPEDWQNYHTRYVTPDAFHYALTPAAE